MKTLFAAAAIGALLVGAVTAQAQDYPSRTIKIVNGPSPDAIPRLVSEKLHKEFGVPVVIDARPGAGGEIAAQAVASAPPDGYTLLFTTSTYTLNTALDLAGYDFIKDFAPVAFVGDYPFVLIVNKASPATSVAELIAMAKAKPESVTCGSGGQGTAPHLSCELFGRLAGVKIVHVPYRGAAAAMTALLGGEVTMSFAVSTAARAQIQGDKVRPLGLTTATPSKLFPGILPLAEAGLPGFDLRGWAGFVAPAKTPGEIVALLNSKIVAALKEPDLQQALSKIGTEVGPPLSPAEFTTFVADDLKIWNKIIDVGGVPRGRAPAK